MEVTQWYDADIQARTLDLENRKAEQLRVQTRHVERLAADTALANSQKAMAESAAAQAAAMREMVLGLNKPALLDPALMAALNAVAEALKGLAAVPVPSPVPSPAPVPAPPPGPVKPLPLDAVAGLVGQPDSVLWLFFAQFVITEDPTQSAGDIDDKVQNLIRFYKKLGA